MCRKFASVYIKGLRNLGGPTHTAHCTHTACHVQMAPTLESIGMGRAVEVEMEVMDATAGASCA